MSPPGFVLRAPWYVRERSPFDLRSPLARRPVLQMYDTSQFVDRMLEDPADSVKFGPDDFWSYPVPATPSPTDKTRSRLATSMLLTTRLRKLYQPMHQRFYVVVVEVFCDSPGLPRAGSHEDISVEFRMRRMHTTVTGGRRPARKLASALVIEMAKTQGAHLTTDDVDPDMRDVWWADQAWRRKFVEDKKDLLTEVDAHTDSQQWLVGPDGGRWRTLDDASDPTLPQEREEMHPMTRLPVRKRDEGCDPATTRSLWFGVVPTFSGEHWQAPAPGGKREIQPKLDEHAVYEIECVVQQPRPAGQEHCPPWTWVSAPTEPFRLAAPMDPDGTKNRTVTITLPDLRTLAARAGQKQGPGGVRVVTPPKSQLVSNPFNGIPKSGAGRIGEGGGICTFAIELFFIVAFFLFLMFLPIVVLAFQLWWMLALRFCIPPSIGFSAMADFLATGKVLADLNVGMRAEMNIALGTDFSNLDGEKTPDWVDELDVAKVPVTGTPIFKADSNLTHALAVSTDPKDAVQPTPLPREDSPDDPLCPLPPARARP